ncbi:MAG TPA: hypothetical protein VH583_14670 [Vicinamibacterales bacterium]|jgi:hypothetical protein
MKLLIKLAIVALIANAAWHVMAAYTSFYRFKDAVQETTQFGNGKSIDQLRARVIALAGDYDLPIGDDDFTVTREGQHTTVDGSYSKPIDLAPGYSRPWTFEFHVDTFSEAPVSSPSR